VLPLQKNQAMVSMWYAMVMDWRQMVYQSMLLQRLLMPSWIFTKLRHPARGYCGLYQLCWL